jgi:uncharacterized membrane protein (UPF0127 family)
MKTVEVRNRSRGTLLGGRVEVADSFWTRLRGLLGRRTLEDGQGLLIVPSRGIHMYAMRFHLDVLLLDEDRRVEMRYGGLAPGQTTGMHRGVRFALELPVGTIYKSGTCEGDTLDWEQA